MAMRIETMPRFSAWLGGLGLFLAALLITLMVLRSEGTVGAHAASSAQKLTEWAPAALTAGAPATRPSTLTPSWAGSCDSGCPEGEPLEMSSEEAMEQRAEEMVLLSALQMEAALE